jgi:ribonuclease R
VGHSLPRGKVDGRVLQGVLDRVRGRPEESLISTVILRSMTRARYDPRNVGHFGLASEAYAHFTSPIRRYPDLLVHRALTRALVDGKSIPERWGGERLADTAEWVSERERVAQRAERDSVEMKKIEFMRRHLGEEFPGTIAGVTSFGFFVLLDRYFVEGLVHVSTLEDDYYRFLPEAYSLVGERGKRRFRLGDRVRVQVARADKEQREIDFMLRDHG